MQARRPLTCERLRSRRQQKSGQSHQATSNFPHISTPSCSGSSKVPKWSPKWEAALFAPLPSAGRGSRTSARCPAAPGSPRTLFAGGGAERAVRTAPRAAPLSRAVPSGRLPRGGTAIPAPPRPPAAAAGPAPLGSRTDSPSPPAGGRVRERERHAQPLAPPRCPARGRGGRTRSSREPPRSARSSARKLGNFTARRGDGDGRPRGGRAGKGECQRGTAPCVS